MDIGSVTADMFNVENGSIYGISGSGTTFYLTALVGATTGGGSINLVAGMAVNAEGTATNSASNTVGFTVV
jgi:outer membrane receptor for monomeric catechols